MTKQIVKKVKKVNPKQEAKNELSAKIAEFLRGEGYEVKDNAEDFGFTGGTLVIAMDKCDVQLKPITPKSGLDRYQEVEFVDEDEVAAE